MKPRRAIVDVLMWREAHGPEGIAILGVWLDWLLRDGALFLPQVDH